MQSQGINVDLNNLGNISDSTAVIINLNFKKISHDLFSKGTFYYHMGLIIPGLWTYDPLGQGTNGFHIMHA